MPGMYQNYVHGNMTLSTVLRHIISTDIFILKV